MDPKDQSPEMDSFPNFAKSLNINAPAFVPSGFAPTIPTPLSTSESPISTSAEPPETAGLNRPTAPTTEDDVADDWEMNADDAEEDEEELDDEADDGAADTTEDAGEAKAIAKTKKRGKKVSESSDKGPKKEHNNIVFIGHVDAGKSTIGGQLLFLTGQVDKRTLEKYEREAKEKNRESWYLSWALDTNQEEREKGKTVEVGRAFFETEHKHFTLLDAPGTLYCTLIMIKSHQY